jgi:hypothetical protein
MRYSSLHRRSNACIYRTQFIPVLSEDPAVTVVNFARTAMWHVPRASFISEMFMRLGRTPQPRSRFSRIAKCAFAYIPLVQIIYRFMIAATVCHA